MRDALQFMIGFFERAATLLQFFQKVLDTPVLFAHRCRAARVADGDDNRRSDKTQAVQGRAESLRVGCDGDERADKLPAPVNRDGESGA